MRTIQKPFFKALAVLISVALLQTEFTCFADPVPASASQGFEQAQSVIQKAEGRTDLRMNSPSDPAEFEALIRANAAVKFIDDPDGFMQWWKLNSATVLPQASQMGEGVNWQTFLMNTYIKYKIIKTNAHEDPSALVSWMHDLISQPWVKYVSSSTFSLVVTSFAFVTGIVYGAMVAGPVAGFINAFLEPLLRPIREKGSVVGTKIFGRGGKYLNSVLFDGKAKADVSSALDAAKSDLQDVRSIVTSSNYQMTADQWVSNMKRIYKSWNHLNFTLAKLPEAYRGGRDKALDMIVFRPKDFANSVTQAITAAETHRQGAEQMVDRIAARSQQPREVERFGADLLSAIDEEMRAERQEPQRVEELKTRVSELRFKLLELGGTPDQVGRIAENYRRIFVFTRQAAGVLASHLLHDAQYSDLIAETRSAFEAMRDSYSLAFFHQELGAEVKDILDRIDFEIDVNIKKVAEIDVQPAGRRTLELIKQVDSSREGVRAVDEPGSLSRHDTGTSEERVKEAVGRAGRR